LQDIDFRVWMASQNDWRELNYLRYK
jgi:seryl-tRNA synthetase